MRIGAIRQNEICDKVIENSTCPNCGESFSAHLMRSEQKGYILFIPFIKATVRYYTYCPHCQITHNFSASDYKKLLNGSIASGELYRTCQNNITNQINKLDRFQNRSDKNIVIAVLFAFIGSVFGLQNWYMGHKKRAITALLLLCFAIVFFIISLGMDDTSIAALSALPIAINVYWGIFDMFRIGLGYAKDSYGNYIMSNRQFQNRLKQRQKYYR